MRSIFFLSYLPEQCLQELAPVSYKKHKMVAGFHRASPSTSLDKSLLYMFFVKINVSNFFKDCQSLLFQCKLLIFLLIFNQTRL